MRLDQRVKNFDLGVLGWRDVERTRRHVTRHAIPDEGAGGVERECCGERYR
jgi:hypothetical protein